MTKMKKFIVVVVGALALTCFNVSAASAASCYEPAGGQPISITNDPGMATLPFTYKADADSASLGWLWKQNGAANLEPLFGSGGPGNWHLLLKSVKSDGAVEIQMFGNNPSQVSFCTVQVRNAISDVTFRLIGKPGKQRIVADFDRRRSDVTTKLVVTQKVKKKRKKGKGKKAQVSTRTFSGFSAKVKPGALVTATLIPSAGGYELDRLETTSSPMKAKKKKKKRKK